MPQVVASDKTGLTVEVLNKELEKFVAIKEKFVDEFSLEDFDYIDEVSGSIKTILPPSAICAICQGWRSKLVRCSAGDQAWGLFSASK